jgi:hypothetical protein
VSGVTLETPGIPRQSYCCYCGKGGVVEMHHVIPRSQGGHAGPQVPLCQSCHTRHHSVSALQFDHVAGVWYAGPRGGHMIALAVASEWDAL